ncbi:unnamed protein product, partial [Staurois parvus]
MGTGRWHCWHWWVAPLGTGRRHCWAKVGGTAENRQLHFPVISVSLDTA